MGLRAHPTRYAEERPADLAYVMSSTGVRVTWHQLDERTNRGARLLRRWGVGHGDVITLLLENHELFLELCWAAQRAGVYFTPISHHLAPGEVSHIVADSGAKVLFASTAFADRLDDLTPRLPPSVRVVTVGGDVEGFDRYEAARDDEDGGPFDDPACGVSMMYTSGTTGRPKGARPPLPQRPFDEVAPALMIYPPMGYGPDTVHFSAGPLYHASPLHVAMMTQTFGGSVVVPGRFDPEDVLATIERHRVTHANFVPTHFVRLLRLPAEVRRSYDLSSLRMVMHGAAPCPPEVKEAIIGWFGPIVWEYYGGSEGFGGSFISTAEWSAHRGSVGRPIYGAVHVMDETTWTERPNGEVGTLFFEDPPPLEYHKAPAKTRAAFSPQGWATFGDVGWVDADGYMYLTDRKAHMIISGGVNVYPQQAENRLLTHPAVLDVAVVGVPDVEYGEVVKAVVQLAPGHAGSAELAADLIAHCRQEVSAIASPRSVDFVDALPRHENGKLYKQQIKRWYASTADGKDPMTDLGPPRIGPVADDHLSAEAAELLEPWRLDGRLYNVFRTMAASPRLLKSWLPFGTYTYRGGGLSPRQTELVILRTTWLCGSRYEFSHHVQVAQRRGLRADEVERVTAGPDAPGWTPLEMAMLRAADELERNVVISDTTWSDLAAELSPEQIMDLVYVCGAYRVGAMVMNSVRVELDAGVPPDTRIGAGREDPLP